jgi:hypothetical protein
LDPGVLLAIQSAASIDWNDRGGTIEFDGLTKEEWRSLIAEKLSDCLMFVDHHGAFESSGGALKPMEKTALDRVVKFLGRDTNSGGSLHSKLILALFKNSKDRVCGRLFIGSKNFTRSQMQEFGAVYDLNQDGKPGGDRTFTNSLRGYLEYLRDFEAPGVPQLKLAPLIKAIEILRTKPLYLSDSSCSFHWQGRDAEQRRTLAAQLAPLLDRKWTAAFFHSPWTRAAAVASIVDKLGGIPVRIACLKEPGLSTLKRPNVRYQLSYSGSGLVQSHQSHSKVYLFADGAKSMLVFGSANLTPDGWGLRTSGCRPNAEILMSLRVHEADYRQLSNIHGAVEDISAKKKTPDEQEEVLSFLNSIAVRVSFDRKQANLLYEIDVRTPVPGFEKPVVIRHDLIEAAEGQSAEDILVFEGWPLPHELKVPWLRADLYLVSSLVRISCPLLGVETHLVVDLDTEFYEGRARLRVLQYQATEILQSLGQLMQVTLAAAPTKCETGFGDYHERLSALIDGLRVERYAYRMARLKKREPSRFRKTIERVDKLLAVAREDESLAQEHRLQKLIGVLNDIHDDLARA